MLKSVPLAFAANGDNDVVAAVAGKRIKVVAFVLSFSGTVNAKFTDGASGATLGGLYYGVANVVVEAQPMSVLVGGIQGHFATTAGTKLVLNLSAGVAVGGHLVYEEANC